ncbi:MAG: hypothetical protein WA584_08155 [Pyrinomonadaceae bacterium]
MSEENKRNILYFEDSSMFQLYETMEKWQNENCKRFHSINIQQENRKFCCIALTNPAEVVITNPDGNEFARVYDNRLRIIDY